MPNVPDPAIPNAQMAALNDLRQSLDYWGNEDHARAADMLQMAQFLIRRAEFVARVEKALAHVDIWPSDDADKPGASEFVWRKGRDPYGRDEPTLNLIVETGGWDVAISNEAYADACRVLAPLLDGYDCMEDGSPDWHDGNVPFTAYGNVTILRSARANFGP